MIDFSQYRKMQINGKEVLLWLSSKKLLWKRKIEYPCLTIGVQLNSLTSKRRRVELVLGFSDKNKLITHTRLAANNTAFLPSIIGLDIISSYDIQNFIEYDSQNHIVHVGYSNIGEGSVFRAYGVKNEEEYNDFLSGNMQDYEISDAEWSLSDEQTGQIRLFATQSDTPEDRMDRDGYALVFSSLGEDNKEHYVLGSEHELRDWPTAYYCRRKKKTEVMVTTETSLITLSSKLGSPEVISVLSNFDEYKTKYNTLTNGQYPKYQYPYLRGDIKIDCKSQSLGINETWGMYAGFTAIR